MNIFIQLLMLQINMHKCTCDSSMPIYSNARYPFISITTWEKVMVYNCLSTHSRTRVTQQRAGLASLKHPAMVA